MTDSRNEPERDRLAGLLREAMTLFCYSRKDLTDQEHDWLTAVDAALAGMDTAAQVAREHNALGELLFSCQALYTAMLEWSEDLSDTNQEARLALLAEARAAIAKAAPEGSDTP